MSALQVLGDDAGNFEGVRNPFQFAKPKGPGFGIASSMYLSVLIGRASPPAIAEVAAPKGEGGAVEAFGVPLSGPKDKAVLAQPMVRGEYAVASRDQKTVLKLAVLPTDEAHFDPEVIARSSFGARLPEETLARIRGTWWLGQLTFASHDPDVYPALDLLLDVAIRLGELSGGVVADPVARRYLLPRELASLRVPGKKVSVQAHAAPHAAPGSAFTLGLQKFAMPELEITGLLDGEEELAQRYLLSAGQGMLEGHPIVSGGRLPAGRTSFEAREGGLDPARWEGIPVLELLPPTGKAPGELLRAWAETVV